MCSHDVVAQTFLSAADILLCGGHFYPPTGYAEAG